MGCCSSSSSRVVSHDDNGHASKKQRTEPEGQPSPSPGKEDLSPKKDIAIAGSSPEVAQVVVPPGMVEMEELQPPPKAPPRHVRTALLPKLVPVQASENEIKGIFTEYLSEVSEDLQKTLDSSWQHLVDDAKKAWEGSGQPLQWFWLMHPEAELPHDSFGLLVLWLQRGLMASHCIISHLSFKEIHRPWHCLIPGVLEALRLQLFQMMPISSIRITLWYTPQDGKMLLDKEAEKPFKEAGYRWFQLANRADSRRGQVMSQKRAQERDGKLPLETPDLCISSCLLVPGRRKVPVVDEVYREAPGNILVLAECIRKHCEDLQAASEPKVLQRTLEGLKEVKGSLVRSNCSADAKDTQDFAAECFKELKIPSELTAWLCRERPESVAKEGEEGPESQVEREVLCAGLALRVNWKAQRGDPAEPETFTEIAGQATATSRQVTESPVVYVATEDDEISVMMCKLSASLPSDRLYEFASRLLKEAPPGDFEDDRLVSHVRLPRLSRCCVACTEAPQSDAESAFDFTFARELFGFRLSSRGTPLGALSVSPPREVLTLDGDFLLAVWHEKYVDLQGSGLPIPLFVAQVRPK